MTDNARIARKALERYGEHETMCCFHDDALGGCDCGLLAALERINGEGHADA